MGRPKKIKSETELEWDRYKSKMYQKVYYIQRRYNTKVDTSNLIKDYDTFKLIKANAGENWNTIKDQLMETTFGMNSKSAKSIAKQLNADKRLQDAIRKTITKTKSLSDRRYLANIVKNGITAGDVRYGNLKSIVGEYYQELLKDKSLSKPEIYMMINAFFGS